MLTDVLIRKLASGGYQELNFANVPCRVVMRRGEEFYIICIFEGAGKLPGEVYQLDMLLEGISAAVRQKLQQPCSCLAMIVTENPAADRKWTESRFPVWLINMEGKPIIFENQPAEFGEAAACLTAQKKQLRRGKNTFYFPYVTIGLMFLNFFVQVIVSLEEARGGFSVMGRMSLPIRAFQLHPEYYRLLSSVFLHFGWRHLFNNMIVLFYLGNIAERMSGRVKYLAAYLICGIGANYVSALWYIHQGELSVVTAGASGAVFGVTGMVLVSILLKHDRMKEVSLRQIILMVAFTLYNGIVDGGVNNCAHIAGMVIGIVCGLVIAGIQKAKGVKQ